MNFAPMIINLLGVKVNGLDRLGTLNFGPLQQADLFVSTKLNMGFGEQNGDLSQVYIPISTMNDSELSDSNSWKNSVV
ncbi:MAG: hypothetical protein K0S25_1609 [Bacillus sp. (in: firmicutes)]|jgi:hypothetical protein|uniref:hypothetical protein n=1 Tax=Bacillus sp. 1NLA3E TaxID=666686 RepID=UPI000247F12D|nr:hypothetical protein [Bacillus sp. 1NLA3E]AGK55555.1 hypothetical protein B1NLA3E_19055 [Bacillus sp. 1NLA3E]MDF2903971.1 hypothetical protein [Bacillus sp. (in: firmicutes)]